MGETSDGTTDDPHGEQFPVVDVLAVFEERSDQARPLTANDVMDALDCSRRTAHNKLNELVEENALATRKVGSRSRVWWVPHMNPSTKSVAVESEIRAAELSGTGETLDQHREALRATYDYLSENPDTTETEILTEVFPENPAGYKTADKWWEAIQPALKELPNVDITDNREHVWHYSGG